MKMILTIILVAIAITIYITVATKPHNEPKTTFYTVTKGDTLWQIAAEYKPHGTDIRKYIYNIKQMNEIGANLQPGQTIIVPLSN